MAKAPALVLKQLASGLGLACSRATSLASKFSTALASLEPFLDRPTSRYASCR